ncbi:MAG: GTPase family protein [Oscillatoriaceae bacterium SKW80]|nr:GTPase family protein [Oscillatoriaceae bacterium SKYG93]MCX8119858.1 GTPase family protein [Oscillatoriaceae bacterium SKW80]MDW8452036.1 GTPase family protein [Oscillatoriaceae cyanobacterium SKYGB_i_bin93]HIK27523.1 GTPase family protein [Oscillatoriaceae cyanobacterium M7585_C2015_266]
MIRLKLWQWTILAAPIAAIAIFLLVSAGLQINEWGINWIWGVFTLVFVGWRWLLVRWTKPEIEQIKSALAEINKKLETETGETKALSETTDKTKQAEAVLEEILKAAKSDRPLWEDWETFWQRCQELVIAIAHIYHPEVKYPLLSIYIPQAYSLIRGTLDDLDRFLQKLSPALNQVTVGQAYQAYETYRKLEPSARKLLQVWQWAQWFLNPAAAAANLVSKRYSNQANKELVANLSALLREVALRNLCRQALALYSGTTLPAETFTIAEPEKKLKAQTQTLQNILAQAETVEEVTQKPINILLVGRTGAGKSSLINTLFQANLAEVDVLPSTEHIQNYQWETATGDILTLWDTPGYEQVTRADIREQVFNFAKNADLLLLVTPALDPALQMDVDFLKDIKKEVPEIPVIAIVTQVDRLRPLREWQPPYDWVWGERPKEKAIREATEYRAMQLGDFCDRVLPVVTADEKTNRSPWGIDDLSLMLIEAIAPTKQIRLARFMRSLETRAVAAAKIIDHYSFQMATTQGLTALLKSPVLKFISTLSTGSPTLAYLLAEQIPVEQLPLVIGKLQMAYDLFLLLREDSDTGQTPEYSSYYFDLLNLWPLLLDNSASPERNAWAFGHVLVEFWAGQLAVEQLRERFEGYIKQD